ncbi:MAG: hypothetical protein EXX96DRAFT_531384 [Benjaminiella poitrasii]|nr:MAG: hypothetical protein EXX96DRAFT_531384 [Benjaminiella poitrasii]
MQSMLAPQITAMENLTLDERSVQVVCGPLLRYMEIDYTRRIWRGSCLLVLNSSRAPSLTLTLKTDKSGHHQAMQATKVETIDVFRDEYYFWRYELLLPLTNESQTVTYGTDCLPQRQFKFHLPAIHESMRFMFYSCSGFSDIPQAIKDKFNEKGAPLWQDVLDRHEVTPFHVMLGGGDQLYQDRLIHEDFMKPWVAERNPAKRLQMKLPQSMKDGFEHFYFWNYVKNFGFKESPVQAQAYAAIPSINMWDDHDIIDGYGSYPADMQSADCFQVLFANASRFYYAFQQHTNMERAESDGMIRGSKPSCNHILTTLGPDIGFLSLDARGERTKYDVCTQQSYDTLFREMYRRLPPTIKHFMVLTGVPLVYPRLTLFEKAMESAASFNLATLAGKTGTLGDIISGQLNEWNGDPELLDDMNDHWTAANHEIERRGFIKRLQTFARDKSVRVSFLGGDVHCCATGRLYSKDMKDKEEGDPFLMVQIVSSAIVNVPPPQVLLTVLNQNASYVTFDGNIEEKMYNLFKFSPNGNSRKNKKLMGMRNYCAGYYDEKKGNMNFWIQAETEVGVKGTKGYLVEVPKLVFGQVGAKLHTENHKEQLLAYHHHASSTHNNSNAAHMPPPPPSTQHQHHHYQQQPAQHIGPGGFVRPPPQR